MREGCFCMKVENLGSLGEFDTDEGITLYGTPIEAGFPSPVDDHIEESLNLNTYLVRNRAATFFLRASGSSMIDAGIHDGDLLIVDRSIQAGNNRIVIAALEGELTVKRLVRRKNGVFLVPANPSFPEIDITENEYVYIWGVVTYVIHRV